MFNLQLNFGRPEEKKKRQYPSVDKLIRLGYLKPYNRTMTQFMARNPEAASEIRRFDRRSATRDYFYKQDKVSADNLAYVNAKSKDYKSLQTLLTEVELTARATAVGLLIYFGFDQDEVAYVLKVSNRTVSREIRGIKAAYEHKLPYSALKQGANNE